MPFDPQKYGGKAPRLEADDLEGDAAILVIAHFGEGQVPDTEKPGGQRDVAYLMFQQTGDKRLYLNATQGAYMVQAYGDNTRDWIGKEVVVEKKLATYGEEKYEKVYVMPPEEWAQYGVEVKGLAPLPVNAAAARGATGKRGLRAAKRVKGSKKRGRR